MNAARIVVLATIALLLSAAIVVGSAGVREEGARSSTVAPAPVEVLDTSGPGRAPCGPVDTSGPFVAGGCPARANSLRVGLEIRTAFGALPFGECGVDFDLTFSRDGRIWFDDLRIGGPAPCSDVWPCTTARVLTAIGRREGRRLKPPPRRSTPPWQGRLEVARDGGFDGSVRLCIDTCAGRYAGEVGFRLVMGDAGWIIRLRSAGAGTSGLEVSGDLDLLAPPTDFDVVAAAASSR